MDRFDGREFKRRRTMSHDIGTATTSGWGSWGLFVADQGLVVAEARVSQGKVEMREHPDLVPGIVPFPHSHQFWISKCTVTERARSSSGYGYGDERPLDGDTAALVDASINSFAESATPVFVPEQTPDRAKLLTRVLRSVGGRAT